MDDILREFLVESNENLDQVERDMLALEQQPDDLDRLSSVFRCVHTIKGTSGFLALPVLEHVAHVGESVLSRLRDGELRFDSDIADTLLTLNDALRGILKAIEATGSEGATDHSALLARLNRLNDGVAEPTPVAVTVATPDAAVAPAIPAAVPAPAPDAEVATIVTRSDSAAVDAVGVSDTSIRVDVALLDKLMTLVGELVLARNQVLQHSASLDDQTFVATSQRLDLITTELQEGVMKTRMQPIGTVWSKLPRVVRDLAQQCGKLVRIELEGKDTELDKTLIEAIKDPLVHIVRNSVDHGIETPEARVAAGKSAEGVLRLRAYHEGGQVNIEITDDGGGINPERVRQTAVRRGVVSEAQSLRLSERDLVQLVFEPGFSTAEKVTNVSGRGVGMDVVRTNIEKIGGTIDLQSSFGSGTTLKIKIPLTLAIIPALIVAGRGERYAIPQVSLLELVRLEGEQIRTSIEMIHGAPVYRLRGRLLPLVHLSSALGLAPATEAAESINIVVLRADDRQFGLVVDSVSDTEEIVVKPLGKRLKGLPVYAGATIMGDGRVALILDVLGLAQAANVLSAGARERVSVDHAERNDESRANRQTLLVMAVGETSRVAVPLSEVARLEQFPSSAVEVSGNRRVVQYRGRIMPLLDIAHFLGAPPTDLPDMMSVVVYQSGDRSVGLVVSEIVDIVEEAITVRDTMPRRGTLGAVVVQGSVTDLLDLEALVRNADLFANDFGSPVAEAA
ncbi:MAG: chemotaxis protein CheW [Gemmatimonadota bacterium]